MLRSNPDAKTYFFNRYRASHPRPVRALLDLMFGQPLGAITPNHFEQAQALCRDLAAAGFLIDTLIMFDGQKDPLEAMTERKQQGLIAYYGLVEGTGTAAGGREIPIITDPEAFVPAADMTVTVKLFSNWFMQHPASYEIGDTDDPLGVGTIYAPLPKDRSDVGARFTAPDTKQVFEKTKYNHLPTSDAVWERIS